MATSTLTVIGHPLIRHKLSYLRDKNTPKKLFKELVDEIAMLMTYEVTRDLEEEEVRVETPLETMTASRIRGKKLAVVPILRAGLGMVEGVVRLVPGARVGHVGLYRDEATLEPVEYYAKVPSATASRDFFVLDPMLATGGSASAAVTYLKPPGCHVDPLHVSRRGPGGSGSHGRRPSRRSRVRCGPGPGAERCGVHPPGPG